MGIGDGGGHQLFGFIAGITKHDPLIASTFVFFLAAFNALTNIAGLLVQVDLHLGVFPVKTILFIADFMYTASGGFFNGRIVNRRRAICLPGKYDPVGRGQGFACDLGRRVCCQKQVNDRVGYAVANLVGMSF